MTHFERRLAEIKREVEAEQAKAKRVGRQRRYLLVQQSMRGRVHRMRRK